MNGILKMDWKRAFARMSGRTVCGSLIPINARWIIHLTVGHCCPSSVRWYGSLADKTHISAGPLELLCKATWTYLERFQALVLHLPEAGQKTGYWVWLGAVVKVCCEGNGLKMSLLLLASPVTKTGLWSLSFPYLKVLFIYTWEWDCICFL